SRKNSVVIFGAGAFRVAGGLRGGVPGGYAPPHATFAARCRCPSKSRAPRKLLPGKANFASRARELTFPNKADFEKSISIRCTRAVRSPSPLLWPKQSLAQDAPRQGRIRVCTPL